MMHGYIVCIIIKFIGLVKKKIKFVGKKIKQSSYKIYTYKVASFDE